MQRKSGLVNCDIYRGRNPGFSGLLVIGPTALHLDPHIKHDLGTHTRSISRRASLLMP